MLYTISKRARRVGGATVPLFISLPNFSASVLNIAAFKEWALKDVKVVLV